MITATFEFSTEQELRSFLARGETQPTGANQPAPAPVEPSPAPEPVKPARQARARGEPVPAPVPAPTPTDAPTTPTAEEVSAAILRCVPVAAQKAAAVATLASFGVQRGKDLKPEQRAPFLVALAEATAGL